MAHRAVDVKSVVVRTPFGRGLYVACDTRGIVASRWTTPPVRSAARASSAAHVSSSAGVQSTGANSGHALLGEAVRQLRAYFAGRLGRFDVPFSVDGTPFEVAVWSAVAQLECGTLISYADVARAVGRPNAYRGVARAMGRTPLALFIPAHRVVGSDGRLKGAAVGSMRQRLIAFERGLSARHTTLESRRARHDTPASRRPLRTLLESRRT